VTGIGRHAASCPGRRREAGRRRRRQLCTAVHSCAGTLCANSQGTPRRVRPRQRLRERLLHVGHPAERAGAGAHAGGRAGGRPAGGRTGGAARGGGRGLGGLQRGRELSAGQNQLRWLVGTRRFSVSSTVFQEPSKRGTNNFAYKKLRCISPTSLGSCRHDGRMKQHDVASLPRRRCSATDRSHGKDNASPSAAPDGGGQTDASPISILGSELGALQIGPKCPSLTHPGGPALRGGRGLPLDAENHGGRVVAGDGGAGGCTPCVCRSSPLFVLMSTVVCHALRATTRHAMPDWASLFTPLRHARCRETRSLAAPD